MIAHLSQQRWSKTHRIVISLVLSLGVMASGISLNLVGHAKFKQTDRVLFVPIGKTVWSYGWPFRWMDKDVADVEINALMKAKESDRVFRTRWGIHHETYDWVNGKYRISIPILVINVLAIIILLLGCLSTESRKSAMSWMKRNPIAILLCCPILLWSLFTGSPFLSEPIEFKLLRGLDFAISLALFVFGVNILMRATKWNRKPHLEPAD